ncbi:hypothetical protein VNI00_012387 [Paramarasmius palmivorus]|uniref:BHLH domain-containing protein n=1 Tax=Paramarasmius palmivorus TaxID=297713 RepID=A0AAW0C6F1_9AGAR
MSRDAFVSSTESYEDYDILEDALQEKFRDSVDRGQKDYLVSFFPMPLSGDSGTTSTSPIDIGSLNAAMSSMSADSGPDPVSPASPVSAITVSAMDLNQPSPITSSASQGQNVNNSASQEASGRSSNISSMFTGFGGKNSSSTQLNASSTQVNLSNLQGLGSLAGLAGFGGALNPQMLMNLDSLNSSLGSQSGMNEGSTTPSGSGSANTGSTSGTPGNVSQQIIIEQFRLAQLQQLQHLQAQIFQQQASPLFYAQMALLNSGAIMGMNNNGEGSASQPQNQTQPRSFHGLPTPGSSTELRASNHPVEFVSPMLLNYADLNDLSNTSSTSPHHASFASTSSHPPPSHVHGHSHSHSHSNPHSLTHTPVFSPHDSNTGGDMSLDGLAPLPSRFSNNNSSSNNNETNPIHHRGTSSAPAHIAFSQPHHSNNDLDFDISPLTSPWLGADMGSGSGSRVHGYHHPQHHQQHSRQNHANSSPFLTASGSNTGPSNKRTASPSNEMMEEYSRKTRQSPAVRATIPSSSSGASNSDIYSTNSLSRRNSIARGSRSVNSTPLLKGTVSIPGSRSRKGSSATTSSSAIKQVGSSPSPNSGAGASGASGLGSGAASGMNFSEGVQDSPSPVDLSLSMPPPAAPASASAGGPNSGGPSPSPSSATPSSSNTFGIGMNGSNTAGGIDINMGFDSPLGGFNFGGMHHHQEQHHQLQSQYDEAGLAPPLMPVTPASIMNLGIGRGGIGGGMFGGFAPGNSSTGGNSSSNTAHMEPSMTANTVPAQRVAPSNSSNSTATSTSASTSASTASTVTATTATGRKAKAKAKTNAEGNSNGAATNTGVSTRSKSNRGGKGATGVSPSLKAILPAGPPSTSESPIIAPKGTSSPVIGSTAFSANASPAVRKTSHKAAEQKRRDSLKTTFDDLRGLLPPIPLPSDDKFSADDAVVGGGYVAGVVAAARASMLPGALPPRGPPKAGGEGPNKGVSKLQLLICGNEYIRVLKGRVERRDEEIERLRREVKKLRLRMGVSEDGKANTHQMYGMDVDGLMGMGGEDEEDEEPVDLEKDLDAAEWTNVRLANNSATISATIPEEEGGEEG